MGLFSGRKQASGRWAFSQIDEVGYGEIDRIPHTAGLQRQAFMGSNGPNGKAD
jgi:hypothetical protein